MARSQAGSSLIAMVQLVRPQPIVSVAQPTTVYSPFLRLYVKLRPAPQIALGFRGTHGEYLFRPIHSFRNESNALLSSRSLLCRPRSPVRKCMTSFHGTHSIAPPYSAGRLLTLGGSRKSGVMRISFGSLALRIPCRFSPASLRWRLSSLRDIESCLIFTSKMSLVPSSMSNAASGTPLLPRACRLSLRQGKAVGLTRQILNKKSF